MDRSSSCSFPWKSGEQDRSQIIYRCRVAGFFFNLSSSLSFDRARQKRAKHHGKGQVNYTTKINTLPLLCVSYMLMLKLILSKMSGEGAVSKRMGHVPNPTSRRRERILQGKGDHTSEFNKSLGIFFFFYAIMVSRFCSSIIHNVALCRSSFIVIIVIDQ